MWISSRGSPLEGLLGVTGVVVGHEVGEIRSALYLVWERGLWLGCSMSMNTCDQGRVREEYECQVGKG